LTAATVSIQTTKSNLMPPIPDPDAVSPLNPTWLERLACVRCGQAGLAGRDQELFCSACGSRYPVVEGIPLCLPNEEEAETLKTANGPPASAEAAFYNRPAHLETYFGVRELPADRERLQQLHRELAPGPVLEIGSGMGYFQDQFPDYVALDYSFIALRRFIADRSFRVCASAETLPFRSNIFSLVFTVAALEHVPRADRAFAEILRVLMPGGVGYVFPAWHCQQWNCDGVPVRPYSELDWSQKWTKLTLPLRNSLGWKAGTHFPRRVLRALSYRRRPAPTALNYRKLRANYDRFLTSDSDACSSLDSYEGILFYQSRGCRILSPRGSVLRRLLSRNEPVIFAKPAAIGANPGP
jgi:SAM-dependent methyltransferase